MFPSQSREHERNHGPFEERCLVVLFSLVQWPCLRSFFGQVHSVGFIELGRDDNSILPSGFMQSSFPDEPPMWATHRAIS